MDKDRIFGERGDEAEFGSENSQQRQVEALSDSELLRYHAALHATKLIVDTTWVPLIEEEMLRRGLISRQ